MKEQITVELESQNGVYLSYKLNHSKNGYVNVYIIEAKIAGVYELNNNALYIFSTGCEALNNNEETLMDEFAEDMLDSYLDRK